MSKWTLYIDETGGLEKPEAVAVGGLLVNQDVWDPDRFLDELQRRLAAVAPYVTWPLHAAHINLPVFHVLARFNARDNRPEIGETVRQLETTHEGLVRSALQRMQEGHRPKIEDLKVLDLAYRAWDPKKWDRSRAEAQETRAGVGRVLREVSFKRGALYFVAGETVLMDARSLDLQPNSVDDNRYAGLLHCTIRRAIHVLEGLAGEHQLTVTVLSRDVLHPVLGVRGPMGPSFVGDVIRCLAPRRARKGRVRAIAGTVAHYREDVHPMLVLTDFATNGTLREFKKQNAALASVERQLNANLGARVRGLVETPRGEFSLSFLSATGLAEDWASWAVEDGTADSKPASPTNPPGRRWAVEQAQEWVNAF